MRSRSCPETSAVKPVPWLVRRSPSGALGRGRVGNDHFEFGQSVLIQRRYGMFSHSDPFSVERRSEGHPHQEPELGVGRLDQGIGKVVFDHVLTGQPVPADLAGNLDDPLRLRPGCPGRPVVQQTRAMGAVTAMPLRNASSSSRIRCSDDAPRGVARIAVR
jgi:hypothetical protein